MNPKSILIFFLFLADRTWRESISFVYFIIDGIDTPQIYRLSVRQSIHLSICDSFLLTGDFSLYSFIRSFVLMGFTMDVGFMSGLLNASAFGLLMKHYL